MITDRDPKPNVSENEPAIGRAPTPTMPADDLEDLLELKRLAAASERRRAAIEANTLPRRPSRGRR
jgi:hypothetical protein